MTAFFRHRTLSRFCRLTLAAVLALNTAALGATVLKIEIPSESPDTTMPCHLPQDNGQSQDGHSPSCDSLCAQCIGFIPGSYDRDQDGFVSSKHVSAVVNTPLPRYLTPPYKPPRV